jgi:hypothetical protein
MNKAKLEVIQGWSAAFLTLCFVAASTTVLYAKFGGWMLAVLLFIWSHLLVLHGRKIQHEQLIKLIDNKASASINLLAESIKLQSKDLQSIHNWIKRVTYPKENLKLH